MSAKLMEYFNKQPRLGTLSTSSKDGKVDVAIFGSPHMIDEKTVVMATAKNRTLDCGARKDDHGMERSQGLSEDE
jgi:hypothetical protein